jgi:hypothetical protein
MFGAGCALGKGFRMEWDQIADRWATMAQRLRAGPDLPAGLDGGLNRALTGTGRMRREVDPAHLATARPDETVPAQIQPSDQ